MSIWTAIVGTCMEPLPKQDEPSRHFRKGELLWSYPMAVSTSSSSTSEKVNIPAIPRRHKPRLLSPKARKANRVYSQWSFAELHAPIMYKATLSGSLAIKVDAYMTSQARPKCGY